MLATIEKPTVNGLDLHALENVVGAIGEDPAAALVRFRVETVWQGQTRSVSTVDGYTIGGEFVARDFKIVADEPCELLGSNSAPNPQELLMSAVNACMMVGYVAQAALRGIVLDGCKIETSGELDLRGFLGLDDQVPPGYRRLDYTVAMRAKGATQAQFEDIHRAVMATSPNYFNMARPIEMNGRLA